VTVKRTRTNDEIRARHVRVIAHGEDRGVLSLTEALASARDAGLDLVEVAPDADPPVCRVMDFSKYRQ
jgi:translation initiation factor IF-3